MCPLPHQVLCQHLRRVPSTHLCGNKGMRDLLAVKFLYIFLIRSVIQYLTVLPLYFALLSSVPSSIRSSVIRANTGMRSVSVAPSVTSLWPRSPSAPRRTASCVGSAAPERTLHAAMAAINPYWLVRLMTGKP